MEYLRRAPLTTAVINRALIAYQAHPNGFRSHQSLDLMTPNEYLDELGMAS